MNHEIKSIFNYNHVLSLIESDYSLAKDSLEGIFTSSDICIQKFKSLGTVKKKFLTDVQRPIMNKQFSQMIDDEGNGRRFKLQTSKFALDFSPGSNQSCMLLRAMI